MKREPDGGFPQYSPGYYHHGNGWTFFAEGNRVAAVSPRKVYHYRKWDPFREEWVWEESSGFMPGHKDSAPPRGAAAGFKVFDREYRSA